MELVQNLLCQHHLVTFNETKSKYGYSFNSFEDWRRARDYHPKEKNLLFVEMDLRLLTVRFTMFAINGNTLNLQCFVSR